MLLLPLYFRATIYEQIYINFLYTCLRTSKYKYIVFFCNKKVLTLTVQSSEAVMRRFVLVYFKHLTDAV